MTGQYLFFACTFAVWVSWVAVKYFYLEREYSAEKLEIRFCNQADRVEWYINQLVKKAPYRQLVLVDTGSTDDTAEILKRLSLRYNLRFKQEPCLNSG